LIRWISFGFCVFNHTPISFIKSSHQHFISRIPSRSLSLLLSLSLVECLSFCFATAFLFFFLTVVFVGLALSFSHTLVCLFVVCSFSHCHEQFDSLTPPPTLSFLFWPGQNFLQNEIVFVLTISLKLNYFYYSDRIRRTKGEKVGLPFLPLPHFTHFPPPCDPFSTHSTLKQKLGVCFLQLSNKLIALLIDFVGFERRKKIIRSY